MPELKDAINHHLEKRLRVYCADSIQIQRDANSAREVARDHIGRWPFELIQNADDAEATTVEVVVAEGCLYIADDGNGLSAEAIESLSGTHYSDKPVGTIGRKGIGFKSVYELTDCPAVFSGQDGVHFSPERASQWMHENRLPINDGQVPHQWLPFWCSRKEAERDDATLTSLTQYRTIVKLPLRDRARAMAAIGELRELPEYFLLTFRRVRSLRVRSDADECEIAVDPDRTVRDSRSDSAERWRVQPVELDVPAEILESVEAGDRDRAQKASSLVAAPIDDDGIVQPLDEHPRIFVYYPTDELSPIPLLIHGDFFVSSDRKNIIPFDSNPFNAWLRNQIAERVVQFVNDQFDERHPAANLSLLKPHNHLEDHPIASDFWKAILARAGDHLRVPNEDGETVLTPATAHFVATSVRSDLARMILSGVTETMALVHADIDNDSDAKRLLRQLGSASIDDEGLIGLISEHAESKIADEEWLWTCWQWLAEWVANEQRQQWQPAKRPERVGSIPILPVNGSFVSRQSLAGRTVVWRAKDHDEDIPDWLPLRFVDAWFRDRLIALPQDDAIRKLIDALGVKRAAPYALLEAFGKAIASYWKQPNGDPNRFLDLLKARDWHGHFKPDPPAQRCPVPVRVGRNDTVEWRPANESYFGRAWGEDQIEELFASQPVPWVVYAAEDFEKSRELLSWLGVEACPRIVVRNDSDHREYHRVRRLLKDDAQPAEGLNEHILEHVRWDMLSDAQCLAVLCLLQVNWQRYYQQHAELPIDCKGPRGGYRPQQRVAARWWEDVRQQLKPPLVHPHPPVPLCECWLLDETTRRKIDPLLPIVDLSSLSEVEQAAVGDWLRRQVGVRDTLSQVEPDEWNSILDERVPQVASSSNLNNEENRHCVRRWYETALDALDEKEADDGTFRNVHLLCRKGVEWHFVGPDERRWIADDDELSRAFADHVWLFDLPKRLHATAKRLMGFRTLTEAVSEQPCWDAANLVDEANLQERLNDVKPYIFAWRRNSTRDQPTSIRQRIQRLSVKSIDNLEFSSSLDGVTVQIKRTSDSDEHGRLILASESQDMTILAQAVAKAIQVPTEADFIENLIRCENHEDRKRKLLSRGMTQEQLKTFLSEYNECEPVDENGPQPPTPANGNSLLGNGENGPQTGSNDGQRGADGRPGNRKGGPETGGPIRGQPSGLKDPKTAQIEVVTVLPPRDNSGGEGGGGGGEGGGDGSDSDDSALTHEERLAIEKASREVVEGELLRRGYVIEQKPQEHPGFDLIARKERETLQIEVKGHRRIGRVVQISEAQREEYLKGRQRSDERWELWNVEHLDANDNEPITITIVNDIPFEAWRASQYRVNLRECKIGSQ